MGTVTVLSRPFGHGIDIGLNRASMSIAPSRLRTDDPVHVEDVLGVEHALGSAMAIIAKALGMWRTPWCSPPGPSDVELGISLSSHFLTVMQHPASHPSHRRR